MTEQAIFAAGCFWGVQSYFDQVPGVVASVVGYTGGHTENPTYPEVCTHTTGHAEAVLLNFDPAVVSYEVLCKQFFRMHNPTQLNRQGPDVGDSYRSAIFYIGDEQRQAAEMVKLDEEDNFDKAIVTEIAEAKKFYEAEDYHQKYTEKMGIGACHIPYSPINS